MGGGTAPLLCVPSAHIWYSIHISCLHIRQTQLTSLHVIHIVNMVHQDISEKKVVCNQQMSDLILQPLILCRTNKYIHSRFLSPLRQSLSKMHITQNYVIQSL